jgi:hypothetical protein
VQEYFEIFLYLTFLYPVFTVLKSIGVDVFDENLGGALGIPPEWWRKSLGDTYLG